MSFTIALSGISAANTDLNTISNNIANSSTTGFKESRTEFGDFFAQWANNVDGVNANGGVAVRDVSQQFSQGTITTTSNPLDMAINGSGFFVLSNNGSPVYTRDGEFTTDANGYVVNSSGARLQVFPLVSGTTDKFSTGTLTDLQLSTAASPPSATTTVAAAVNLPSDATAPTDTTFSPTDTASYNSTTSTTVYDSLGTAHTVGLYYVASGTAGQWTVHTVVDGTEQGTGTAVTFDSSGALTSPTSGVSVTYTPTDGANAMTMSVDMSKSTQYGSTFSVNSITQNGYSTGQLSGVSIDTNGVVTATYSNGQTKALGEVAMANFANEQGLQQTGNSTWTATTASGSALLGAANTSSLGSIQSEAIESSNVDLTAQLVSLMNAQRNYQANSQVISTDDKLMQTILQL